MFSNLYDIDHTINLDVFINNSMISPAIFTDTEEAFKISKSFKYPEFDTNTFIDNSILYTISPISFTENSFIENLLMNTEEDSYEIISNSNNSDIILFDNISEYNKETTNFDHVLTAIKNGKRARRENWHIDHYIELVTNVQYTNASKAIINIPHNSIVLIRGFNDIQLEWTPSTEDLLANDWLII